MRTHESAQAGVNERKVAVPALLGLLGLLTGACGFFDDVLDDGGADGETDTGSETTGTPPPPPPSEGFRVYPKFMLQDVPAIVTIEGLDGLPDPCVLDGSPEEGYLCDATGFPSGLVGITVERDGFETAVRHPELIAESIETLDVHLVVAGGPPGTWSACVPAGMFETCGDVCTNEMRTCAVTSCATGQDEWPVASYEVYEAPECVTQLESFAATCDDPLPVDGVGSLRCCCVD
jgi:hypothetical protein